MAKGPPKKQVTCPHCAHVQDEPLLVQSTNCRKCGAHINVGHSAPAAARPAPTPPKPGGLLEKAQGWFGHRGPKEVRCFECATEHTVVAGAKSTICPACSASIDLNDIDVPGPYTRNIRTRGNVTIGPKGDLGSARADCTDAVVEGKLRGELLASGKVRLLCRHKLFGGIEAQVLVVEKKADVECARPLRCHRLEVHGKLRANVRVDGTVVIHKNATLIGSLQAASIVVEKGGIFEGALKIEPLQTSPPVTVTDRKTSPAPVQQVKREVPHHLPCWVVA